MRGWAKGQAAAQGQTAAKAQTVTIVPVAAMSMAMRVLSLQATIGGQPGQAAAMAKATTMAAVEELDSWAAPSAAAGP